MYTFDDCTLVDLECKQSLTDCLSLPFKVKRVFYSYDVPSGQARGAHAHKECHQLLVAVNGAFEVVLDDGVDTRVVKLDNPKLGLHIPPYVWAEERAFLTGTICLVLASHEYDEQDYIRSYEDFLTFNSLK